MNGTWKETKYIAYSLCSLLLNTQMKNSFCFKTSAQAKFREKAYQTLHWICSSSCYFTYCSLELREVWMTSEREGVCTLLMAVIIHRLKGSNFTTLKTQRMHWMKTCSTFPDHSNKQNCCAIRFVILQMRLTLTIAKQLLVKTPNISWKSAFSSNLIGSDYKIIRLKKSHAKKKPDG